MEALQNVNFQILLKQHGGNFPQAKAAWERICSLGGFGQVPVTYEGGLDLGGLRTALQESDQDKYEVKFQGAQESYHIPLSPTLSDDIKRIEDLAAGDTAK